MDTLFTQLIADFHERDLPSLISRETQLPALNKKIDTVIGMRRSGKTYFLYQRMQQLLEQTIAKDRLLYINFDDDRLHPLSTQALGDIISSYYRLYPENKCLTCYFFFDEIHNVSGWERFVRRLQDTENIQLCLTGSSAKLLSREIATTLRGRSISTEIFPFSFREALRFENIELPSNLHPGAQQRALLQNRFHQYLSRGGFPEVQPAMRAEYRIRILQEYVDVVVLRDIIERHQLTNITALRYLIRHCLNSPATLFSINKFHNNLKSQSIAGGKNALHEYLDYLVDTYLLYVVPVHTKSLRRQQVNPRKIYTIDTGLALAFSHRPHADWGRLLENFVFISLRKQALQIAYYRTQQGYEVDFITTDLQNEQHLYQVTLHLNDDSTREREIRALIHAMQECQLIQATLITLEHEEQIKTDEGVIHVIPAWLWAYQLTGR